MVNNSYLPEILQNGDDPDAVRFMNDYYFLNDRIYIGDSFPTTGASEGYAFPQDGFLCIRTDYSPYRLYVFVADVKGTATSGGSDYLIDTSEDWDDDDWNGYKVAIIGGTGKGQVRDIDDTVGADEKIIVTTDWVTNPDSTSVYQIYKADDSHWEILGGGGGGSIQNVQTVSPSGAEYTSIQSSIDACSSPTENNQYLVIIYPGDYEETVDCAEWVHLFFMPGARIEKSEDSTDLLTLASNCKIFNPDIYNTSSGSNPRCISNSGTITNCKVMGLINLKSEKEAIYFNSNAEVQFENIFITGHKKDECFHCDTGGTVNIDIERLKIETDSPTAAYSLIDFNEGNSRLLIDNLFIDSACNTSGTVYGVRAENGGVKINYGHIDINNSGSGEVRCLNSGANSATLNLIAGYLSAQSSGDAYSCYQTTSGKLVVLNNAEIAAGSLNGTISFTFEDFIKVGTGADANIYIYANNGDANLPGLRYNSSTNKWQYSNDGSAWSDIGSGGGGGVPDVVLFPNEALLSSSDYPDKNTEVGTNKRYLYLDFASVDENCDFTFKIPSSYSSESATLYVAYLTPDDTNTGHYVRWEAKTKAVGDGEVWDEAGNTDTFSDRANKGTATHLNVVSQSLTTTGFSANDFSTLNLKRVTAAGTACTGAVTVIGLFIVFS